MSVRSGERSTWSQVRVRPQEVRSGGQSGQKVAGRSGGQNRGPRMASVGTPERSCATTRTHSAGAPSTSRKTLAPGNIDSTLRLITAACESQAAGSFLSSGVAAWVWAQCGSLTRGWV